MVFKSISSCKYYPNLQPLHFSARITIKFRLYHRVKVLEIRLVAPKEVVKSPNKVAR